MLAFLLLTIAATVTSMPQYYDDYGGGDVDFEACGRGLGGALGDGFQPGPAKTGEYPHMCVIYFKKKGNNAYLAGGSLVQNNQLITLASAVKQFSRNIKSQDPIDADDFIDLRRATPSSGGSCGSSRPKYPLYVRCGDTDLQTIGIGDEDKEREVELVLLHPEYDHDQLINDIAILVVKDPFTFSSDIGRVCLPFPGDVYSNQRCVATGYGKDSFGSAGYYSKELKKVDLPLIDQETCQETLNQEYFASKDFNFVIHGSFICAGGIEEQDTCEGDGGGPLVCTGSPDAPVSDEADYDLRGAQEDVINLRTSGEPSAEQFTQIGVVAWGIQCGSTKPGVYTNVAHIPIRCWIHQMSSCHKAAKAAAGGEDVYEDVIDLRTDDDVELKTFCEEFVQEEACCRSAGGEEDSDTEEDEADYDLRGVNDYEDIIGLRTDDGPDDTYDY